MAYMNPGVPWHIWDGQYFPSLKATDTDLVFKSQTLMVRHAWQETASSSLPAITTGNKSSHLL